MKKFQELVVVFVFVVLGYKAKENKWVWNTVVIIKTHKTVGGQHSSPGEIY